MADEKDTELKLVDGKLVEVDKTTGEPVVKPVVDGPVVGPAVVTTLSGNSESNPVGVVGPLEGKDNADKSPEEILRDAKESQVSTVGGRVPDSRKDQLESIKEDMKSEDEKAKEAEDRKDEKDADQLLRKIETEGRAAADRDMPAARNLPHTGPNEPNDADKTAVREDGTVTTVNHPELTATYLHGTKVLITDAQRQQYEDMLKAMNDAAGDTAPSDIPLNDPYWQKKQELDAFVARLKR